MRNTKRTVAFLGAVLATAGFANAQANAPLGFFDWDTNTSPGTNFQVSPFISDDPATLSQAIAALNAAKAKNRPLAVKVVSPLTTNAAKAIFNDFAIQYVFADFEGADSITQTKAISTIVVNSTKSQNAFVGNFNVYPESGNDGTRGGVQGSAQSFGPQNVPQNGQYSAILASKNGKASNRMANEALYPGAPDFRNPASGNSGAPNIRSALFTLPIIRAGATTKSFENIATGSNQHIPWVSRFNNWGNNSLNNANDYAQYAFEFKSNAPVASQGQLPSRGDFQAQVLHYRMRGVDSVNLFEADVSSVVGYSRQDARNDVVTGWGSNSVVNGIFSRKKYAFANLGSVIGVTGGTTAGSNSSEAAGAIWSGVYDTTGGATRRLAILISNLSNSNYNVDLPNNIGGFATYSGNPSNVDDYAVTAGHHRLLTFTLSGNRWQLASNDRIFTDDNRNGTGIPEPATLGLLGAGAMGLLIRRRRKA